MDYRPACTVVVLGPCRKAGSIFRALGSSACPAGAEEGRVRWGSGKMCSVTQKSQGSLLWGKCSVGHLPSLWEWAELWTRRDSPPHGCSFQGSRKAHPRLGDWNTRRSLSHDSGGQEVHPGLLPPELVWGTCARSPPPPTSWGCAGGLWGPSFWKHHPVSAFTFTWRSPWVWVYVQMLYFIRALVHAEDLCLTSAKTSLK